MAGVKEQIQKIKQWGDGLFWAGLFILVLDLFLLKDPYVWGIGGFLVSAGFIISLAARTAETEVKENAQENED